MGTALAIINLVVIGLPILLKVLKAIQEASNTYQTSEDKQKWVMQTLETQLPKLNSDEIYNWVKVALYAARLVGVKI